MAEDHWSRNECPVKFSECPTGSDDTKTGIGIERKKIDLLLFEQMIDFGKNNI